VVAQLGQRDGVRTTKPSRAASAACANAIEIQWNKALERLDGRMVSHLSEDLTGGPDAFHVWRIDLFRTARFTYAFAARFDGTKLEEVDKRLKTFPVPYMPKPFGSGKPHPRHFVRE